MSNSNEMTIVARQSDQDPLTFTFQVQVDEMPISEDYVFLWDFGDGKHSDFPEPEHTYASKGEYTVSVEVGEGKGPREGSDKTASVSKQERPPKEMASKKIFAS